jgi:hypothetical protein
LHQIPLVPNQPIDDTRCRAKSSSAASTEEDDDDDEVTIAAGWQVKSTSWVWTLEMSVVGAMMAVAAVASYDVDGDLLTSALVNDATSDVDGDSTMLIDELSAGGGEGTTNRSFIENVGNDVSFC